VKFFVHETLRLMLVFLLCQFSIAVDIVETFIGNGAHVFLEEKDNDKFCVIKNFP
jgi:hypothetical protein